MTCAPFSMLGSPGRVRFPVHGGWDSRDVSVAGICDCVRECVGFIM